MSFDQEIDENKLIRWAAAGDAEAFQALILPYQKKAYAYALRQTGDPDLAEDICQDALIKAFIGLDSFAGKSSFSTWLFRIIYTTFLDHVRKAKIRTMDALPDGEETGQVGQVAMDHFRDQLRRQEREEWLMAGILKLPPDFRTVVVLRDIQGFSYREIGEITGEAEGTVKSRISRARERLRRLLTAPEDAPAAMRAAGGNG